MQETTIGQKSFDNVDFSYEKLIAILYKTFYIISRYSSYSSSIILSKLINLAYIIQ